MTDRELLILAAAAEGHPYPWVLPERGGERPWNPLQDDGDAQRLAVALGLSVEPYPYYAQPKHSVIVKQRRHGDMMRESNPTECVELHRDSDPNAATRRAIVRAAAALGSATGADTP